LIIAHRGASGLAPENTLAAFKLAIALGVDGVEMDVQLSADGEPVIMHDLRVNRTTDGAGPVHALRTEELRRLDAVSWFERRLVARPRLRAKVERAARDTGAQPSFPIEGPPLLAEALALLAPAALARIYVELKGARTTRDPLLEATISVVRKGKMEGSVTLLSFDHNIVAAAKGLAPEIRTALTFPIAGGRLAGARSMIKAAESAGADEVALHFGLAARRVVESLHERNVSVSAWTANRPLVMRRLAASGVDSIMTNFPDRLRGILDTATVIRVKSRGRGVKGWRGTQ